MSTRHRRPRIRRAMLIAPPGKITVTAEGSRERKLAVPPLGLAYLAASLQRAGVEVEILDVLIEGYDDEQVRGSTLIYGLDDGAVRQRIADFDPDLVGVSCLFSNRAREAIRLCELAREAVPDAHVVLGGQHPTGMPAMIEESAADYVLVGEADEAIVELVRAIDAGADLHGVPQLVMRDGGRLRRSPATRLPDVRTLPWPAWEHVDLARYWRAGLGDYEIREGEHRFIVMLASRGCPYECAFCTAPLMTERRYRKRDDHDVVAEIRKYVDEYGVEEVHFWDDNFFVNRRRVKEVLRLIADHFPDTRFQVPSGSEINRIDDEVIDLLARANFTKVFLNVESGDEEVQARHVDKNVRIERVEAIVAKLRARGIVTEGVHMVGFPGETREQMERTFAAATSKGFDRISVSIVNPLPGTALWQQCEDDGLFHDDFDVRDLRWSSENIRMVDVERGWMARRRVEVWQRYMGERVDVERYQRKNVTTHAFDPHATEDDT